MNICSPMARGNGAHVVHKILEKNLNGYAVCDYNPYWTFFPPALPFLCSDRNADIIHTTPDYGLFFHREDTPLIITFHNYMLDNFMQNYSSLAQRIHYKTDLNWFTKHSLNIAAIVTSVSKFTAELIKKKIGYTKKIRVIYNGVNAETFKPVKQISDGPVKVLFSGNLTQRKGAHLLPKIADKLNPGIVIQYTRGLRTNRSILNSPSLQDIGSVKYSEMPKLYQQADILLFPTVREGFSLAVLEAMASGLPVVATDCSSLPEQIIPDKGGSLCQLGNADDFARSINELADSPQLRREMGQFNRARIENEFTVEKMIKNYHSLFEEMLSSRL